MFKLNLHKFSTVVIIAVVFFFSMASRAELITQKTPADVYVQVELLSKDVQALRDANNIQTPWPKVAVEPGRQPHHVFQKTLEILDKINRYRINVAKIGAITVPRFPGRDITPNEVYSVVSRLRQELLLLVNTSPMLEQGEPVKLNREITPADVYAKLSEISIVLDETLGIRGITPSEVYIRSKQVLQLAKFLHNSQNLPMGIPRPKHTVGKLPNHALKSVNQLLLKVQQAEKNLWMTPIKVTPVPRRVITPVDVYDAMGLALAELQRIQFRLGLERSFDIPRVKNNKTPDDVIQNTEWAWQLLPEFKLENPLVQYDRNALKKTPNDVYSVTEHVLEELIQYRHFLGVKTRPNTAAFISGLQPSHVYEKTLEVIEKINLLRLRHNLGPIVESRYPLRKITPTEVFNQVLQVDEELDVLYQKSGVPHQLWITSESVKEYEDKTPADVFLNMQKISLLLDTLLDPGVFTPDYVYREAELIRNEIHILADYLDEPVPDSLWSDVKLDLSTRPENVYPRVKKLLQLVLQMERRAGMFKVKDTSIPPGDNITPAEVYNLIRVVASEITKLKVFLGINQHAEYPPKVIGKTPGHVLQIIQGNISAMETFLHIKHPVEKIP